MWEAEGLAHSDGRFWEAKSMEDIYEKEIICFSWDAEARKCLVWFPAPSILSARTSSSKPEIWIRNYNTAWFMWCIKKWIRDCTSFWWERLQSSKSFGSAALFSDWTQLTRHALGRATARASCRWRSLPSMRARCILRAEISQRPTLEFIPSHIFSGSWFSCP